MASYSKKKEKTEKKTITSLYRTALEQISSEGNMEEEEKKITKQNQRQFL